MVFALGPSCDELLRNQAELVDPSKLKIAWFGHQAKNPFAAWDLSLATDLIAARDEAPLEYLRDKRNLFLSDLRVLLHTGEDALPTSLLS